MGGGVPSIGVARTGRVHPHGSTQSSMSVELEWFLAIYDDLLTWFPDERVGVLRDKRTAEKRASRGDLSFFSSELPAAHQRLLVALETSGPAPEDLHLGWLTRRILDPRDRVDQAVCLKAHRQVCHALYKLEVPYTQETVGLSLDNYCATEESLELVEQRIMEPSPEMRTVLSLAKWVLSKALPVYNRGLMSTYLRESGFRPRHGPGSVATGEKGEEKWFFKRHFASLHSRFPYYEYFLCRGTSNLLSSLQWYRGLERGCVPISKMVTVPKDSRGPRLICEEPLEVQFLQQGYLRVMTAWANQGPSKGHVFFDSQEKHRALALTSSDDGQLATLDLKDASDRVTRALVHALFPTEYWEDLDALRSTHTTLPDGRVVPLRKMSPMGSAVCFPTMAFVLWALCVVAMMFHYGHEEDVHMHDYDIFIFGDDIIVPGDAVSWVTSVLQMAGLKVNRSKSFWRGPFRESCGVDACNGIDITPTRIRKPLGSHAISEETKLSWYAYINAFRRENWTALATAMERQLRARAGVQQTWDATCFPGIVVPRSTPLGVPTRYSKRNCCVMALAEALEPQLHPSHLAGELRLFRNLTQGPGEEPGMVTFRGEVKKRRKWRRALRP